MLRLREATLNNLSPTEPPAKKTLYASYPYHTLIKMILIRMLMLP